MSSGFDDPFAPDEAQRRREARERAIELLYEAQLKGVAVAEVIAAELIPPDPFAASLATGVEGDAEALDERVAGLLRPGWTVDRLAVLDLWILRLGLYELGRGDAPSAVAISEAVELASAYGATDESSRFVNGVLAAAARQD